MILLQPRRQTVAPVVDLKRRNDEPALHFNMVTGKVNSLFHICAAFSFNVLSEL